MIWSQDRLLLVGIELSRDPSGPNLYSAAPTTRPPKHGANNPSVGSADGGDVNNWGRQSYPFGGVLDPEAAEWKPLPDPPGEPADFSGYTAASGDMMLGYEGWILNYPDREWTFPPTPPDGYPHGATVILTDSHLVTLGRSDLGRLRRPAARHRLAIHPQRLAAHVPLYARDSERTMRITRSARERLFVGWLQRMGFRFSPRSRRAE
jgi:hypothetical protein